jgi:hypothetical protein
MKRILLAFVLALACSNPTPKPDPPVPPAPATCADVCQHMSALGCPSGLPTPRGIPCTTVCENVQTSGNMTWNLDCRAHALTCDAADACQ